MLILLLSVNSIQSQDICLVRDSTLEYDKYFSLSIGAQISGIKSEDFVSSNISPQFTLHLGGWLVPSIGIQIGVKGFFFKYIGDKLNHNYVYLYLDGVLNINRILSNYCRFSKSEVNLYVGGGLFINYFEDQISFCHNLGIQYSFQLYDRIKLNSDISAIIGWDIYQGNWDILPSISLGTTYLF